MTDINSVFATYPELVDAVREYIYATENRIKLRRKLRAKLKPFGISVNAALQWYHER